MLSSTFIKPKFNFYETSNQPKESIAVFLFVCLLIQLQAQKLDKVYADLIQKYTTDKQFLPKQLQTFPDG